jgi:hypothetical protein
MNMFDRMMSLDRRWVFLFLAVVCVATYFFHFQVPVRVEPEVKVIYDFIDSLPPGKIVFVAIDYDPASLAELDSMKVDHEYNGKFYKGREIKNGVDYVFLGYKPYPALVILGMGQNFRIPFPTDYYGTPLDSLPAMHGVQNYDQVACVIDISGTNATDYWITYGQGRFNFPLAIGLTGVMGADYYPFLGSGQVFGLMAGLYGAAQYEHLADNPGRALDGMRVQLYAHIVIILFIVLGNIGYFMSRRERRKENR